MMLQKKTKKKGRSQHANPKSPSTISSTEVPLHLLRFLTDQPGFQVAPEGTIERGLLNFSDFRVGLRILSLNLKFNRDDIMNHYIIYHKYVQYILIIQCINWLYVIRNLLKSCVFNFQWQIIKQKHVLKPHSRVFCYVSSKIGTTQNPQLLGNKILPPWN